MACFGKKKTNILLDVITNVKAAALSVIIAITLSVIIAMASGGAGAINNFRKIGEKMDGTHIGWDNTRGFFAKIKTTFRFMECFTLHFRSKNNTLLDAVP